MLHRLRPDRPEIEEWRRARVAWLTGGQRGPEPQRPPVVTVDDVRRVMEINDVAPNWVDRLIAISYHPITRTDAVDSYHSGAIDRNQLLTFMLDNGYAPDNAERLVQIQEVKRARRLSNLSGVWTIRKVLSAYKRGEINGLKADDLLRPLIADPGQRQLQLQGAQDELDSQTRGEAIKALQRAYFVAAIEEPQARDQLRQLGMDDFQAERLVMGWDAKRRGRFREPSAKMVIDWMRLGVITPEVAHVRLTRLGYERPDVDRMVWQGMVVHGDRLRAEADRAEAKMRRIIKDARDAHRAGTDALEKRRKELEKQLKELEKERERVSGELDKRKGQGEDIPG